MQETNLSAIDLNLLVVLGALLETRSTTLAAQKLALSQPATSHALSRLRELFGDPLLVRAGRQLAPTPLAEALAPRVERALSAVQSAFFAGSRFDPRTTTRTYEIGTPDYAASMLVPRLVQVLARRAPHAELFVKPSPARELDAIEDGQVELVLMPAVTQTMPAFRSAPLFSERFVCVARCGHPLLKKGRMTLDAFCEAGHVLIAPRGKDRRGAVDEALASVGRKRRVVVAVPHFSVAPQIAAESDLVLTLAERAARALAPQLGLTWFQPPLPLPGYTIAMHWHVRHDADPGHVFLREALVKAAKPLHRNYSAGAAATSRSSG